MFKQSPRFTPRSRLDETRAARQPILKWTGHNAQTAPHALPGSHKAENARAHNTKPEDDAAWTSVALKTAS